jgi:hypothetical protein
MAMGKKKRRQESMWLATSELPKSPGHPSYERLNGILEEAGFDRFAEKSCEWRARVASLARGMKC